MAKPRAGLLDQRRDERRRVVGLGMPLHADRPCRALALHHLGKVVFGRPARDGEARADVAHALVVVRLRRVLLLARRAGDPRAGGGARGGGGGRGAGAGGTWWSAPSNEPSTRRWSSWPTSSGMCWLSVPPAATFM